MRFLKMIVITIVATVVLVELYFSFVAPSRILKTLFQTRVALNSHDVVPRPLNPAFSLEPTFGKESFYFKGRIPQNLQKEFDARVVEEAYFPYYENGEIHPPKMYDIENNYSEQDIEKIKLALSVAYRYADINKALEDGYRIEDVPFFSPGMGTHVINIEYVLDDEVSVERPEFLNYIKNRETGSFQLVQLGFIAQRDTPYGLFDAKDAQGHFHVGKFCFYEENDVYMKHTGRDIKAKNGSLIDSGQAQGLGIFDQIEVEDTTFKKICDTHTDGKIPGSSIWMMHFAVNMYNDLGMFADYFSYIDYLSADAITYSFLGKKQRN